MFLSLPAFKALSINPLMDSKSPELSKSTLFKSAFLSCWFLQNDENSSSTYSRSDLDA